MNKTTIRQLTASTLLWLAACVIVGLASNAAYAQGTPNKLESIDVQNVAGQQVQLTLRHSSPPSEPVAFTIDNPARISLDLANTALALPSRRIDIHTGGVDSVLAAEAAGRTRLVLNLDRLLPYHDARIGQRCHRPDRRQLLPLRPPLRPRRAAHRVRQFQTTRLPRARAPFGASISAVALAAPVGSS